jgi:hypothetical protein
LTWEGLRLGCGLGHGFQELGIRSLASLDMLAEARRVVVVVLALSTIELFELPTEHLRCLSREGGFCFLLMIEAFMVPPFLSRVLVTFFTPHFRGRLCYRKLIIEQERVGECSPHTGDAIDGKGKKR